MDNPWAQASTLRPDQANSLWRGSLFSVIFRPSRVRHATPQDLTDCRKVTFDENATALSHLTKMEEELAATVLAQQYLIAELQETIKKLESDSVTWETAAFDIVGHSYYRCTLCSTRVIEEWEYDFICVGCVNSFCEGCAKTRFCKKKKRCLNCWSSCPPKHRHQAQ